MTAGWCISSNSRDAHFNTPCFRYRFDDSRFLLVLTISHAADMVGGLLISNTAENPIGLVGSLLHACRYLKLLGVQQIK